MTHPRRWWPRMRALLHKRLRLSWRDPCGCWPQRSYSKKLANRFVPPWGMFFIWRFTNDIISSM